MASSRLLTKILADFLFGLYLLSLVLKHATNHKREPLGAIRSAKTDSLVKNTLNFLIKI